MQANVLEILLHQVNALYIAARNEQLARIGRLQRSVAAQPKRSVAAQEKTTGDSGER